MLAPMMVEYETRKNIYIKLFHTTLSPNYWHFRGVWCLQLQHSRSQSTWFLGPKRERQNAPLITSGSTCHCVNLTYFISNFSCL